jgi:hypothetical protein
MALLGKGTSNSNNSDKSNTILSVRVVDIILNISHPRAEEFGGYDSIGTIFYGDIYEQNQTTTTGLLPHARPYFSFIKQYPLKNEVVQILNAPTKDFYDENNSNHKYYLPNVNIWNHQHNNALPNSSYFVEDETTPQNYKVVAGQTVRIAEGDNSVEVPLGEYFKENLSIQPLLPFEGDTIVEGRFGNSIRLGATAKEAPDKTAYSTKGETGDPITIIRNGALVEESDNGWEHTIENINSDHSTIYLTSNQVLPNMEIVSLHWQSWMAKHDELQVDQKDTFDNITEGFGVETIEPEKPEETADQELEEATEEDIAAQEEKNEDPEDCDDCYEAEEPTEETVVEDTIPEGNNPPTDPPNNSNEPTVQTMPPDYGPETFEKEIYKGFRIMETNSRFDGIFMWRYEIEEKDYPAGSVQEYVQYENGRGSSNTNLDSLKETIDEYIEEYDDGYRIED